MQPYSEGAMNPNRNNLIDILVTNPIIPKIPKVLPPTEIKKEKKKSEKPFMKEKILKAASKLGLFHLEHKTPFAHSNWSATPVR